MEIVAGTLGVRVLLCAFDLVSGIGSWRGWVDEAEFGGWGVMRLCGE